MALQAVKHGFPFPVWPNAAATGAPTLTGGYVIDAAGEKAALIFTATAAKAIQTIYFRTVTVVTGDTVDVRVETVDGAANGDPTGTLWAANTNGACVVASSDDNVWKSATLTANATLAVGDVVAIVIANGGSGGNIQIAQYLSLSSGMPYGDLFTAAWSKQASIPLILIQYSDGTFEPIFGMHDLGAFTTQIFDSDDATNRRGNIFQVPFPCRTKGCWVWVDADAAFTVKIYDSDGSTVLATTASINAFQRQANGTRLQFYPFLAPANLAAGVNYRMAMVPSTTTAITGYDLTVPAAAALDMFPGGQACHATAFTSAAWVETTTKRTMMGIFLDAFDDATGGGGGGAAQLINSKALVG